MTVTSGIDYFVQWHLTERCNLRCKHCYQSEKISDELSLSEIRDVTEEIADMLRAWSDAYGISFSPSLNITGGEPFLHEDILEILEDMRRRGFNIYILTNGILINAETARLLSWLGIRGVQVSIEGPEEVHESIRGKGSFRATVRGVRHLLEAGLKVTMNVTLSELNVDYFMDIVELATSLGVQRLGYSRLVPSGRGAGLLGMTLSKERVEKTYRAIRSLDIKGPDLVTGDPVASQMSGNGKNDAGLIPVGGCAAGVSGLTILPDGTVTPCRRLPVPIGNVRTGSLREMWAESEVLEALRDRSRYKGKCRTCSRWADCRGCRAIAYAFSRSKGEDDFLAEDPQCFIGNGSPAII